MKCSPGFRKRVAEQAELARRKAGRGYTGQLLFTYGEVKWILEDLARLYEKEQLAEATQAMIERATEDWDKRKITPVATPLTDLLEGKATFHAIAKANGHL